MSRRQSIVDRAKQAEVANGDQAESSTGTTNGAGEAQRATAEEDAKFASSRPVKKQPAAQAGDGKPSGEGSSSKKDSKGPASRPNRRRDVAEETEEEEDRFPWHFQFDDDEPEELQASSPLLSRAFRATIG